MTKAPISLQELRRRIYRNAKSDKTHRFWGLFVHVTKIETLEEAYRIAKSNGGGAGVDGQKFSDIESGWRSAFRGVQVRRDGSGTRSSICTAKREPLSVLHQIPLPLTGRG